MTVIRGKRPLYLVSYTRWDKLNLKRVVPGVAESLHRVVTPRFYSIFYIRQII